MGNTATSAYQPVVNTEATTSPTAEPVATPVATPVDVPQAPVPQPAPAPVNITAKAPAKKNVDPLIEMVTRGCSEQEIIRTLDAFMGKREIGKDANGQPVFDIVDQTMFTAPVLYIFSDAVNYGKVNTVRWLMDNFVPLNVSYDNNFCFFECQRWGHTALADMIVEHESFYPSTEVLDNLLTRSKYNLFRKCMTSPHLRDEMNTYRFTFMHYIDNNQYVAVNELYNKIKQRKTGTMTPILDPVYPNPKLVKPNVPHKEASVVTVAMTDVNTTMPTAMAAAEPMQVETGDVIVEKMEPVTVTQDMPVTVNEEVTVTVTYDQNMAPVDNNNCQ